MKKQMLNYFKLRNIQRPLFPKRLIKMLTGTQLNYKNKADVFEVQQLNLNQTKNQNMINLSEQNSSLEIMNQEDSMFKATETQDHIDRINKSLKAIMHQNQVLEQQILQLRTNPKQFIQPLKNQLIIKINELQKENSQLRRQVEQSKIPVFSEMKRKSFVPNQNFDRDSMKSSNRQSMRSSLNGRGALSQMNSNSNYDKNEIASTCFNEQQRYMQPQQQINPILKLQKPTQTEEAQRERLTHQIRYLIARTQIFEKTMDQLNKKERKQCQKNAQKIKSEESQIAKIQKYKKKLCDLLNKLKHRQIQMDEMVKMYKQLHADTIKKLQESTQALRQLQQEKIDDDIEKKYAEVLQLEERLQIINAELQQMDEQRWLEKALKQLAIVFKRLGIPIPKFESVRGAIDELCQILIEHHLMCKQDNTDKLIKLKQYQEEEKQNNQRLIQALKTKEQILSKKLNNIQIQKGSNTKK